MIKTFKCKQTAALFERKFVNKWQKIKRIARLKLEMINAAYELHDLTIPPKYPPYSLYGSQFLSQ